MGRGDYKEMDNDNNAADFKFPDAKSSRDVIESQESEKHNEAGLQTLSDMVLGLDVVMYERNLQGEDASKGALDAETARFATRTLNEIKGLHEAGKLGTEYIDSLVDALDGPMKDFYASRSELTEQQKQGADTTVDLPKDAVLATNAVHDTIAQIRRTLRLGA